MGRDSRTRHYLLRAIADVCLALVRVLPLLARNRLQDWIVSRGFVHRDIAARNVLLARRLEDVAQQGAIESVAKLGDFGHCQAIERESSDEQLTKQLMPSCMPPEYYASRCYDGSGDV
jgi:serine/threonine protein kinase